MNTIESQKSENITGTNLKRIREKNGISVNKLAELTIAELNLTVDDILLIEDKNHVVYDYELMWFSKYFNVEIEVFFK